ncbi:hypothetical protein ABDI30_24060, partial [Paenibacillus cisolokensis]|uniref:hypothetical protein n=1 Tax=Paenibacillus cisolokensis TaxID=1658519 RepID=UPI003D2AE3C4
LAGHAAHKKKTFNTKVLLGCHHGLKLLSKRLLLRCLLIHINLKNHAELVPARTSQKLPLPYPVSSYLANTQFTA